MENVLPLLSGDNQGGCGVVRKVWIKKFDHIPTLVEILGSVIKIQLHATHVIANSCSCLKQVACDIQLHVTLRMQHVYTVIIYMFIHTYQFRCIAPYMQFSLQLQCN
jgi:tetrahydromethanopterin S-methyltransferase subunit E